MALYRTYRPARLADVIGQEHVTGPLRRALENDRVHHAYLFAGPRGCGKTSTARILARSLNCEQGPTPEPCGQCRSCLDLAPNGPGSLDVIELDAASHGGVDDTRELRERAMFAPAASRFKVYIVDEAHMVTTQGFNALLKLVEEPPAHVRFVFATTEADKVLPTIRSRTHNYTFRLISARTLQAHLADVCQAEGVPAESAALALVARAGAGSARDSLSVLGQVISGSGPDGVTYADAVAQLGLTDATLLDESVDALAAHDGAALFTVVDRVVEAGHDPRRFVTDLLERVRDLIVLTHVPDAAGLGLIDAPQDQVEREIAQAARFGPAELARAADVISTALSELKGATAPRLHLELLVARLLLPAADTDEAAIRARLDQMERRVAAVVGHQAVTGAAAGVAAPADAPGEGAADAVNVEGPARAAPTDSPRGRGGTAGKGTARRRLSDVAPSTGTEDGPAPADPDEPEGVPGRGPGAEPGLALPQIAAMWPAVLDAVKSYSRVSWMAFSASAPVSLSGGELAVALADAGTVKNIRSSGHEQRLEQALRDVLSVDIRVDVILDPSRVPAERPGSSRGAATANRPDPSTVGASVSGAQSVGPADPAAGPTVEDLDAPSPDDTDVDASSGVELAMRELGATTIGEIEH